jgi:oxygen-independent coproporphyrinogen-3 oxidase
MMDGINCKDFSQRFDKNIYREYGDAIRKLTESGLIQADDDVIKLTARGIDLSNQVFSEFI